MKKLFFTFLALSVSYVSFAQIKTYSVSDANQDESVDISDVNKVISKITGSDTSEQQVVNADDLNSLLKSIDSRLAAIEEKLCLGGEQKDTTVTPTPSKVHEYVDLGLPSGTLWATTNVGAENPEDVGLYFAWGETTGYTSDTRDGRSFNWANYKWCNGSSSTMTKYSTSTIYWDSSLGTSPDNKTELESADDAATVNWGKDWQMPSYDQITELYNSSYTTTTWTTKNEANGRLITSKTNGNSIFLPAAGYRFNSGLNFAGSFGLYWSRSLLSSSPNYAYYLYFDSSDIGWGYNNRCYGQSVRPVRVTALAKM